MKLSSDHKPARMAGSVAVLHTNGVEKPFSELSEDVEFEKILDLHDAVFAGTHPRLKVLSKAASKVTAQEPPCPPKSLAQLPNGAATISHSVPPRDSTYNKSTFSSNPPTNILSVKSSNARQQPPLPIKSSGLDPIFLEKSEDLIKAEMRLERQRIERSLEEQLQQKKQGIRQRISDQEALPDFDVSDVLTQAQELVKPITAVEMQGANGTASSSDSIDDVTFYSSQMNESTADEADEHPKRRKNKPCKYFFGGHCKMGDRCNKSHDPAFRQKLQGDPLLTMDIDSPNNSRDFDPRAKRRAIAESDHQNNRRSPFELTRGPEAGNQLNHSGPGHSPTISRDRPYHHSRDSGEVTEEPAFVPDQLQDTRLDHQSRPNQQEEVLLEREYSQQGLGSPNGRFQPGSTSRRNGRVSPAARDMRVVRNHITSPVAPQPARVSPLAVAKVPRLDQLRRGDQESYSPYNPRQPGSGLQSPSIVLQPLNPRKRRREADVADNARIVTARRDLDSPVPYIKDEPITPPPFSQYPRHQDSRNEQVSRQPLVIESTPPHLRERVVYQMRPPEPSLMRVPESQRASTPIVRRVVSRAGYHYEIQDEPEVRQVFSARQPRRVGSPQQDLGRYSAPHTQPVRAASHSYIVQPEIDTYHPYRASVQPRAVTYSRISPPRHTSLSPELRTVQYLPQEREVAPMGPPLRRVVVDQHGNRFYEAPLTTEPRSSVVPASRFVNEQITQIERPAPRRASVHPQLAKSYDDGAYIRTVQSPIPTSPRYVEYYPPAERVPPATRQRLYEPREEALRDRHGEVRVIEYPPERLPQRYEELAAPRDGLKRMHSVRPSEIQYEIAKEHIPRGQTVQPEHERMVDLSTRREMRPPVVRQVSVRAGDRYERPAAYVTTERPRYQYVSDGRETGFAGGEVQDDVVMGTPRSAGRRPVHRL